MAIFHMHNHSYEINTLADLAMVRAQLEEELSKILKKVQVIKTIKKRVIFQIPYYSPRKRNSSLI